MSWDPGLYHRFESHRLRPALDLLARIHANPDRVVDLGCGTGATTAVLQQRWPDAHVTGVDSSAKMLARADEDFPTLEFVEADISGWTSDRAPGVVFSNAALQWLDDHHLLFPRLMRMLESGGTLAVQMPHNHAQAAYQLIDEMGRRPRWINQLDGVLRPAPVADPEVYHGLVAPLASHLDVWETEYLQVLSGDNPVATWLSGTFIRPVLEALGDEAEEFRTEWADRVLDAYPPQPDGSTLFRFKRLFVVARA